MRTLALLLGGIAAGISIASCASIKAAELAQAETSIGEEADAPAESTRRKPSFAIDPAQPGGSEARSKLRNIGVALQGYHDANRHFPSAVIMGPDGKTPHSWRVAILPYLGRQDLYERYHLDEAWDSPHNKLVIADGAELYNVTRGGSSSGCSYFVLTGPGSAFDPEQPPCSYRDIADGSSRTLCIVEAKRLTPWTKPEDLNFTADAPLPKFGGVFASGFHMAAMDGSVPFLPQDTDEATLRALISRDGGEPIEWDYDRSRVGLQREDATPGADDGKEPPIVDRADSRRPMSKEEAMKERLETIRMSSATRLKMIGMALQAYRQVNRRFPPAVVIGPDGKTPHSWRVALLPYLDCEDLYKRYRLDEPWDSPHNKELIPEGWDLYTMPTAKKHDCCYFVLTGPGSAFDPSRPVARFSDSPHYTLGVVEARRAIPWTKPEDLAFTADAPLPKFGGYFKDGFGAMFLDTSVRFLRPDLDESVLRALISANGRESIEWDSEESGLARLREATP
jgi:hypothetical protein